MSKRSKQVAPAQRPEVKKPNAAGKRKFVWSKASTRPTSFKKRGTHLKPPSDTTVIACRAGTKQAALVDTLRRPGGATMSDLLKALSFGRRPWCVATVRSGFTWDLKRKGYGVESVFDKEGNERFRLVVPPGQFVPEHAPVKGRKSPSA